LFDVRLFFFHRDEKAVGLIIYWTDPFLNPKKVHVLCAQLRALACIFVRRNGPIWQPRGTARTLLATGC
jgi:hypothetical protein